MKEQAGLGRLETVELKSVWSHEATVFTPWLAEAGNLEQLSDVLGMDLELESRERNVGPFRADLLCKDRDGEGWVLIENQLEKSDHTHLGQLLTYAAGLEAQTVVWVTARFCEEHRAALDWLNRITTKEFRCFGVEVELWRIGNSAVAPRFSLVAKPNDWSRSVARTAMAGGEYSETRLKQEEFWREFEEHLREKRSRVKGHRPAPKNWMNFGIGKTGVHMVATLSSTGKKRLAVELRLNDENAKSYFAQLEREREAIEKELGFALVWENEEEKKASRLECAWEGVDPLEEECWPEYREWMQEKLEAMERVFRKRAQQLVAATPA